MRSAGAAVPELAGVLVLHVDRRVHRALVATEAAPRSVQHLPDARGGGARVLRLRVTSGVLALEDRAVREVTAARQTLPRTGRVPLVRSGRVRRGERLASQLLRARLRLAFGFLLRSVFR